MPVEELLRRGSVETRSGVIRRMLETFPQQVTLAESRNDSELALTTYYNTAALPSLVTEHHFKADGFQLNGPLFTGSPLITAYRGLSSFVVKAHANVNERERVLIFNAAVRTSSHSVDESGMLIVHRNVIPFKLWCDDARPERTFMIMPKMSSTLEPIESLSPELVSLCWENLSGALHCVHGLGFSHGDVKPANIGVREGSRPGGAQLVLMDLGSIQRFGLRAIATEPYVPEDLPRPMGSFLQASKCLDWWMLAVTICEKGFKMSVGVGGARSRSAAPRRHILETLLRHQGELSLTALGAGLLEVLVKCEDDVALQLLH